MTNQVLRAQIEIRVANRPSQAFQPSTPDQYRLIARVMDQILGSSDKERLAVLAELVPYGRQRLDSTRRLSKAEASVLIQFLFDLPDGGKLEKDRPVSPEARAHLLGLRDRLRARERQALIERGQLEMQL